MDFYINMNGITYICYYDRIYCKWFIQKGEENLFL